MKRFTLVVISMFLASACAIGQPLDIPDTGQGLDHFLADNWPVILGILYEVITRAVPNWRSVSILRIILNITDALLPDRRKMESSISSHDTTNKSEIPTVFDWLKKSWVGLLAISIFLVLFYFGIID